MAVDLFLKLGDKIKGESIDGGMDGLGKPLKDQIHSLSWTWHLSQQGSTHEGTGGGAGRANVGDMGFTKFVDLSSNELIKALTNGEHFDKALLTVRKAGGVKPVPYYVIELADIIVSSYSISGSEGGGDRMIESFALNFARYRIKYTIQDTKGGLGASNSAAWDIPKNQDWA